MFLKNMSKRVLDDWGHGHYGASRGGRPHNGQDFMCNPDVKIQTHIAGEITKYGFCYKPEPGKTSYRYVEVTDKDGYRHRFFYCTLARSQVGQNVFVGDIIGYCQDISKRYRFEADSKDNNRYMINHVHYEVKTPKGNFTNPNTFL